jgi:hypothetical protein
MEMIIFPALSMDLRPVLLFKIRVAKIPAPKTKNPLGWRVGRLFLSGISLTETPLAARMDLP